MPPASAAHLPRRRVLAAALAAPFIARTAKAEGRQVTVMTYDGFIPPDFRRRFEAETGIAVRIRLIDGQAPEMNLLLAEQPRPQADIATVAGHRLPQFIKAGLLDAVDTGRLRGWVRLDPLFTEAEWLRPGGACMGVPLAVGAEVLVCNAGRMAAPDSWGAMFDPALRRRTSYMIEDFLQCVMLWQGADATFMSYLQDPAAAARAVEVARDMLIRHKQQVLKYYGSAAELQQLLLSEEVLLAQSYAGTLAHLVLAGRPIRTVVPREGSLAFAYNLSLVRNAANADAAYRFLDALLSWPGMGAAITRSSGYASTFRGAAAELTERERAAYLLPPDALARLRFYRAEGQSLGTGLIERVIEQVKAA